MDRRDRPVGAITVYFVRKGALKKFTSDISVPSGPTGRAIVTVGVVGYVAKGIALAVVGALIVLAAVTLDPRSPPASMVP